MKTVILQQDITWADCEENIRMADAAIDSSPGADLYILPEMFSTGFCTEPETLPDDIGEKTLGWMKEKAAQTGAAIAGSSVVKENGRYFNRFFFVVSKTDVLIRGSLINTKLIPASYKVL